MDFGGIDFGGHHVGTLGCRWVLGRQLLQVNLDLAVEVVFPSINYQKVSSSAGYDDATTTDEDDMKLT